jgi:hypothetical protein
MGELVASWLGPAPEIIEDAALAPGQVRILLGPEFNYIDDPSTGDGTTTTTTPQAAPGATPAGPPMVTTTTFPGGWSPTAPPSGVTCS